jgi:chorismate--pyruvate lyase
MILLFERARREPVWKPVRQLGHLELQPDLSHWLFDASSLTERLISSCNGPFSIQILTQGWGHPMLNEARRLRMRVSSYAFIRQVHLCCNGQPWVFARTVIPPHTLTGKRRRLARLGKKPLGAVLFADKSMQRSEMEITRISPGQDIYTTATEFTDFHKQAIWGRRSVFYLKSHPLLVCEIFLPGIGAPSSFKINV